MGLSTGKIIGIAAVVVVGGAVIGTQIFATAKVKKELDAQIAEAATENVVIEYDSVTTSILSNSATLSDVRISAPDMGSSEPLLIDEVSVSGWDIDREVQTNICLDASGIDIPLTELYAEDPEMRELGYGDTARASISWCYDLDIKNGSFSINDFRVSLEDIGALSISVAISNVNFGVDTDGKSEEEILQVAKQQFEANPMMLLGALSAVALNSAEARYDDAGFVPKVFEFAAKEEGRTVADLKAEAKAEFAAELDPSNEYAQQLRKVVERFIDDPDTIRLTVQPKNPLPVMSIASFETPEQVMERLNVEVKN